MTTSSSKLWLSIREILTSDDWTPLQELYAGVAQRIQFDSDDLKPEVGNAKQRAWQRNVRNVLGAQVKAGAVERATSGPARYRLRAEQTPWAASEIEAAVSDYLAMLKDELRGIAFNKTEHRRSVLPRLHGRSEQSLEFKHQNISAILANHGLPYLQGYKPRAHYQAALWEAVTAHLEKGSELADLLARTAQEPPRGIPTVNPSAFVPPPARRPTPTPQSSSRKRKGRFVDFAALEARNAALGQAGEEWVLNLEKNKLVSAGHDDLAARVEWVSRTQGDGLGYDIASFETDRSPIVIEVKTTVGGPELPFLVTAGELAFSKASASSFRLYRVFNFKTDPKVYVLPGDLATHFELVPRVLEAHLRAAT